MFSRLTTTGARSLARGTIDLYKTNRLAMRKWGVRSVDIEVLEWGSPQRSLEVLAPRKEQPPCPRHDPCAFQKYANHPAFLAGLSFDSGEVRRTFRG